MPFNRIGLVFLPSLIALGAHCSTAQVAALRDGAAFWGFTAPWDTLSATSVRSHGAMLDAIVTGWIALDSISGRPIVPLLFSDTVARQKRTPPRMAIVTSWHNDRFHARSVRALGSDIARLNEVAGWIASHARRVGYSGLVLDFEALLPGDLTTLLRVAKTVTDSAHANGIRPVVIAIPAEDTAAYPAKKLLAVTDLVLVMLYDQHWSGSAPGPIAAPSWVRRALGVRLAEADPSRIVAGLPTYGYYWRRGTPGESVSFAQAQQIARGSGVSLVRDRSSLTLNARGTGRWDLWVTDAQLLDSLVRDVTRLGVSKFALWRLGQEDPAIWGSVIR